MSSDRVLDYLTEELVVEKNIVRPTSISFTVELMSLSLSSRYLFPGNVSLFKSCSRHPRKPGQKVRCAPPLFILPDAGTDPSAASSPSTTPSTRVLRMLAMRPISSEESRASRTWTACEMRTKWLWMTKRWTKVRKTFPRRRSHWSTNQTSSVRFPFAPVGVVSKPYPTSPSLKGAVRAHSLCSYLQPFPFTHSREHHPCLFSGITQITIQEPALLCEPAKSLRDAGKSLAAGFTVALGRITGPDIKVRSFGPHPLPQF